MTAYMTHIWSIDYDSSWVQDVIIRMSQWGLAYFLSLGPFFSRMSSTLLCTVHTVYPPFWTRAHVSRDLDKSYLHINPMTPFCWPYQNLCPIYKSKHQHQKYFKFHSLIFFEYFFINRKFSTLDFEFYSSLKKIKFFNIIFSLWAKTVSEAILMRVDNWAITE